MRSLEKVLMMASNASNPDRMLDALFEPELLQCSIDWSSIGNCEPARPGDRAMWLCRLAEWIFFRNCIGIETPGMDEAILSIRPFGGKTPRLRDLLNRAGAAGCFPLAGQNGTKPRLGRLYLWQGSFREDSRNLLHGQWQCPANIAFFVSEQEPFDGNSWEAAAALTLHALQEKDFQRRKNLALYWLVTGEMLGEKFGKITIGNKLTLPTARKWLIPADNASEGDSRCYPVSCLAGAWNWLGESILAERIQLREIAELHVTVGEALMPAVSCALQIFPQQVWLWPSQKTLPMANAVADFLNKNGLDARVGQSIPSGNMAWLNAFFTERFRPASMQYPMALNATGGNRLMGYAALLAAHRNGNVQVVYRDIDMPPWYLQVMEFRDNRIINDQLCVDRVPAECRKSIQLKKLFDASFRPDCRMLATALNDNKLKTD